MRRALGSANAVRRVVLQCHGLLVQSGVPWLNPILLLPGLQLIFFGSNAAATAIGCSLCVERVDLAVQLLDVIVQLAQLLLLLLQLLQLRGCSAPATSSKAHRVRVR